MAIFVGSHFSGSHVVPPPFLSGTKQKSMLNVPEQVRTVQLSSHTPSSVSLSVFNVWDSVVTDVFVTATSLQSLLSPFLALAAMKRPGFKSCMSLVDAFDVPGGIGTIVGIPWALARKRAL